MLTMQREMERSGLIEEMVGDAMDALDGDDVEEDTALEVDKVVAELTGDLFKDASDAPVALPTPAQPAPAAQDEDLDQMKARLQAL